MSERARGRTAVGVGVLDWANVDWGIIIIIIGCGDVGCWLNWLCGINGAAILICGCCTDGLGFHVGTNGCCRGRLVGAGLGHWFAGRMLPPPPPPPIALKFE